MKANFLVFVILGALVLGGLFFVFKPKQQPSETSKGTEQTSVAPTSELSGKTFELVVKGKKLVSGSDVLKVTEGDTVMIKITADEDEELHVHGYDVFVNVEAGKPAELKFTADKSGRFPFELEHQGLELGALEVEPK